MIDIMVYESGSGGEIMVRNNDVVTVNGYENNPYLAQFGGNAFWGDGLLMTGDQQHVAQTEEALNTNTLSSSGRIAIEEAMKADLAFLPSDIEGTSVSVATQIAGPNRLNAQMNINGTIIYMNWNPDELFLNYALDAR